MSPIKAVAQSVLRISRFAASPLVSHVRLSPAIVQICFRRVSTTPVMRDNRSLMKLKKLQADYQCEDGRPIFLKAGLRDRLLYGLTVILCYIGVANVFLQIYDLARPTSWKTSSPC